MNMRADTVSFRRGFGDVRHRVADDSRKLLALPRHDQGRSVPPEADVPVFGDNRPHANAVQLMTAGACQLGGRGIERDFDRIS
jgi:hypothetical protein